MKRKLVLYTEIAYVLGIVLLAFGTALMEKADFGMSMVVAPAYLVYLKISRIVPGFTFGMAEYCLQAVLLLVLSLIFRKVHRRYIFSFVTAVVYGFTLDLFMKMVGGIILNGITGRIVFFICGMLLCSLGVAMLFHTYISPEAYELFVKEISSSFGFKINKTKTIYDVTSCLIAVIMSFIFFGFGKFEGVKLGTVIVALLNGWIIGLFGSLMEKKLDFADGLKLRWLFEEESVEEAK